MSANLHDCTDARNVMVDMLAIPSPNCFNLELPREALEQICIHIRQASLFSTIETAFRLEIFGRL